MAGIPEQTIERIREQVDIVDVVGGHVGLKRSGKQFKGLCPFHDEKSPSFYVDPTRRSFKCFGCGAWGDVFDFIQKVEGVGFLSAVQTLGARVGVALPNQSGGDVRRAEQRERDREIAYRVNNAAAEIYRELLLHAPTGEAGRVYQRERGIDEDTADSFRVGYAPSPEEAGWDTLVRELQSRQLPLEVAEQLGLVAKSERSGSYYDRFRGRLMFPIIQPGGRVLGFSGRILPAFAETDDGQKAPKYINSPESLLYKKSKTLFGIHAAGANMRAKERGILVEGQIDVVAMHQRGYIETVAPLGTALTQHQCELLARFTDTIVLCFDGDRAGTKAAYAALPLLLEQELDVRIAALDPGEDPDSTDPARLAGLLERPRPAILWFIDRMITKGALRSVEAKVKALDALLPLLRHVRRPSAAERYADLAAHMLEVPVSKMRAAISGQARSHFLADMPHSAPMRSVQPLPTGQASVTALLVERPELARTAEKRGVLQHLRDERLEPIARRVIEAAKQGEPIPSEGQLLELVDPRYHRMLHEWLAPSNELPSFMSSEDPGAALDAALVLCQRDELERQRAALLVELRRAQSEGDGDKAKSLGEEFRVLGTQLNELRAVH